MSSDVQEKAFRFSVRIVRLNQYLRSRKKEFVLSNQILRSGTSVGANLAEAEFAITRRDFALKLNIALKEASETRYWLRLLHATGYLTPREYDSMISELSDIIRMLASANKKLREEVANEPPTGKRSLNTYWSE